MKNKQKKIINSFIQQPNHSPSSQKPNIAHSHIYLFHNSPNTAIPPMHLLPISHPYPLTHANRLHTPLCFTILLPSCPFFLHVHISQSLPDSLAHASHQKTSDYLFGFFFLRTPEAREDLASAVAAAPPPLLPLLFPLLQKKKEKRLSPLQKPSSHLCSTIHSICFPGYRDRRPSPPQKQLLSLLHHPLRLFPLLQRKKATTTLSTISTTTNSLPTTTRTLTTSTSPLSSTSRVLTTSTNPLSSTSRTLTSSTSSLSPPPVHSPPPLVHSLPPPKFSPPPPVNSQPPVRSPPPPVHSPPPPVPSPSPPPPKFSPPPPAPVSSPLPPTQSPPPPTFEDIILPPNLGFQYSSPPPTQSPPKSSLSYGSTINST